MKRILKISLLCMTIVLLTSGCVKINYDMKINANKSVDFSALTAYMDELNNGSNNLLSDEEKEKLTNNGVRVADYKENGYTGYRLQKSFENIDDISSDDNISNNIEDFFDEKPQTTYFFTIEKGFLKNKYKASFDVSNMNTDFSEGFDSFENDEKDDTLILESDNTETIEMDNSNLFNDNSFNNMMQGMEAKFTVRLPYKNISNNASSVSKDGKTLTWDFITNQNIDKIEFEFEIWDQKVIYIGIFLVVVIIITIIASIINRPKKVITSEEAFQKQIKNSTMGDAIEIDDVLGVNMVNK